MNHAVALRTHVLRALARARTPGLHFAGHFAGIVVSPTAQNHAQVIAHDPGYCRDADGAVNVGVVAMAADVALAASIRSVLDETSRVATVSMSLQWTRPATAGVLVADGEFRGLSGEGDKRQGFARVVVEDAEGAVCHGNGAFIVLPMPRGQALPEISQPRSEAAPLDAAALEPAERELVQRADALLAEGADDFLGRLWDYVPQPTRTGALATMRNGPHVANRVGHAQGGVTAGLGAATANAAMGAGWRLTGLTACFTAPGLGPTLRARSRVLHRGLATGVVRTRVTGVDGRVVLEVLSTHARG